MIYRCALTLSALLAVGSSVMANDVRSLYLDELAPGTQFEVATDQCRFHFEVVAPQRGETLARGAVEDDATGAAHRVFLLGATPGRQPGDGGLTVIRMGQLRVGMAMEMGVDTLAEQDRRLSSTVQRITLLPAGGASIGPVAPETQHRGPAELPAHQRGAARVATHY